MIVTWEIGVRQPVENYCKVIFFLSRSYIQLEIPEHIKSANAHSPESKVSTYFSN